MSRTSLCAIVLTAPLLLGAAPAAAASSPLNFTSVDVDLPFGERMFPGPNADAINNNCLACHSAGMVLTQPSLPRKTWQAEVEKMRSTYKAPVADQDVGPIVDYLAKLKGAD
ncbi:cytochrome c [Bradyrhizobium sp.]|uniref:cytochrome c n=1 Tax=Bradyrhizobium sp. TaxID=376 RepID=UPI003C40CCC2